MIIILLLIFNIIIIIIKIIYLFQTGSCSSRSVGNRSVGKRLGLSILLRDFAAATKK